MLSWRARSWRSSMTRSTGRRSYAPPSWKSWSKPGLKPGRLRRCITYDFVFCLFYDSAASKILFQAALKEPFIGITTTVEKFEFCWGQFLFLIFSQVHGDQILLIYSYDVWIDTMFHNFFEDVNLWIRGIHENHENWDSNLIVTFNNSVFIMTDDGDFVLKVDNNFFAIFAPLAFAPTPTPPKKTNKKNKK